MRKSILPVAIAAALTILVASCSGTERGPSTGDSGGTMLIAQPVEGTDILPPFVTDVIGRMLQDLLFDRLAEISDDMQTTGDKSFKPQLADKWSWSADSLSIAFSINPKARWHDGKPVTAADVRYSFRVYTDTAVGSPVASSLTNVDSVSVRDSLTAVIWFKRHTPTQFYDAAYQLLVMPEHVYGSIPGKSLKTSDAAQQPIGSGRFRFGKHEAGVRLELLSDTANYRGRAKLDRVIIVRADNAAGAAQVLAGQVDLVQSFPPDQVAKLDSSSVVRPVVFANLAYGFLAMNPHVPKTTTPHPIFSDVRVRRALSMAVDRKAMLTNVYGDKGRLSHGPFTSNIPFVDTSAVKLLPYDTTAAKALLDSAGWRPGADGIRVKNGKPLKFSILASTSSAARMRYAVLMQEAFRKVGAQMDLDQLDFAAYRPRYFASDYDATISTVSPDPSPTGIIQVWGTAGIGEQNSLHYSNKVVDANLDSATLAFDPAMQKKYTTRAMQQVVDDAPGIWLYDLVEIDAVNRRFETKPLRPDGWWSGLADWTIPADKRIDRDKIGLGPAKP